MLIMINGDNKMNIKRDDVRIIWTILDLHGVIILIILISSRIHAHFVVTAYHTVSICLLIINSTSNALYIN